MQNILPPFLYHIISHIQTLSASTVILSSCKPILRRGYFVSSSRTWSRTCQSVQVDLRPGQFCPRMAVKPLPVLLSLLLSAFSG